VPARVVFIREAGAIGRLLTGMGVPFLSLDFPSGRAVLWHPRRFARAVAGAGQRAILVERGFLSIALRLGGYAGVIVAVEHGAEFETAAQPLRRRWKRVADRAIGELAADGEVAVSDFMLRELVRHRRRSRIFRIYNGLDLERFQPARRPQASDHACVVGWAGRLVRGKGVDDLLAAVRRAHRAGVRVRIAGDGPERPRLEALSHELAIADRVEFLGYIMDVAGFWQSCDIAAIPSRLPEPLSMAAIEAMACGCPIVASAIGGLPEVVGDAGILFDPGDVDALARALEKYAASEDLRLRASTAARQACTERFDIRESAANYAALLDSLARAPAAEDS
jgi:glycosyltransferase involved in cell wall biosynthesis